MFFCYYEGLGERYPIWVGHCRARMAMKPRNWPGRGEGTVENTLSPVLSVGTLPRRPITNRPQVTNRLPTCPTWRASVFITLCEPQAHGDRSEICPTRQGRFRKFQNEKRSCRSMRRLPAAEPAPPNIPPVSQVRKGTAQAHFTSQCSRRYN